MSVVVDVFLLLSLTCLPFSSGAARFTNSPINKSVIVGKTVEFVWDYTVDNRNTEFGLVSPKWHYYSPTYKNWTEIGNEDVREGWNWTVTLGTFPTGLRDRVSKKSNATLVIKDVRLSDTGIYRCQLLLTSSSLSKEAHLFVAKVTTTTTTPFTTPVTSVISVQTTTTASSTNETENTENSPGGDKKLRAGEIAGIAFGVLILLCCCCVGIYCCCKKGLCTGFPCAKKNKNESDQTDDNQSGKSGDVMLKSASRKEGNEVA